MKIEEVKHDKLNYLLYRPENENGKKPLILFLHGFGERGDDLSLVPKNGLHKIVDEGLDYDAYIIAPQCPGDTIWLAKIETLGAFLDEMIKTYNINTDRISVTGISMGGYGTWMLALANPGKFCAIAPCCGGGPEWYAHTLTMPVWAFHGTADPTVNMQNSVMMINGVLRNPNHDPDVRLTIYEGVPHNCWERAYGDELFKWLLSKSK